jgi:hypothetical protein
MFDFCIFRSLQDSSGTLCFLDNILFRTNNHFSNSEGFYSHRRHSLENYFYNSNKDPSTFNKPYLMQNSLYNTISSTFLRVNYNRRNIHHKFWYHIFYKIEHNFYKFLRTICIHLNKYTYFLCKLLAINRSGNLMKKLHKIDRLDHT